ncbi:MAG: CehA/McbA family metallohydrolase [Myxococcaceae bacterium]|nr:CehA/McbA family metallohydrolase [Myxococcaceae bacterium]
MRRVLWLCLIVELGSCTKGVQPATAFKVNNRAQLVGGQRALGDVGDFKLSNGIIHAIVQDVGYSRGFGAFGGSLIDVDLVRANKASATQGVQGNDYFTEMFPAFFLQAIEPAKVEVTADGSDGGPAIITVSGRGGDFISIVKIANDLLIPKVDTDYQVQYILEPGKQYLKVVTTVFNHDAQHRDSQYPLAIPFGFITLLGEGQHLFVPGGAGFDMRYYLEEVVYKRMSMLEALPGAVSSMWATEGNGVSYALAASPENANYMPTHRDFYPEATARDSLLIPIASSSFLGTFWARPPTVLKYNDSFSFTGYLAVGSGDVASVQKVIYEINDGERGKKPTPYGTLSGRVVEAGSLAPLDNISVVIQAENGTYQSQARTQAKGFFSAPVPKGRYRVIAVDGVRTVAVADGYVDVDEKGAATQNLTMERPAELEVTVRDTQGRLMPSKVSVEAVYAQTGSEPPRHFLYDLKVGERFLPSDLAPDTDDPETRRYLEGAWLLPSGSTSRQLRPGHYKVYASRGMEYAVVAKEVDVKAGVRTRLDFALDQVLPTPGWVSGDFHVHSINSVDSSMGLDERVASYAAEGVDVVTSTDHNYVTDFVPTVDKLKLNDWLKSVVGLELTSLEMGHFNAYPLALDPGAVTHGSFRWFRRPPGELFAQLRGLGKDPQQTIVQVNHPRDTVLGYFNAFNIGTYTGTPIPPTSSFPLDTSPLPDGGVSPYDPSNFSLDFDALEVFNGKRDELIFTRTVPAVPPPGPEPTLKPCAPGQVADCIPGVGEIIHTKVTLPDGGTQLQPAFPGALDEWFTLLGQGRHITATGNSDSHGPKAEAGTPRTYMKVGDTANGSMRGLSEAAVMDAIRRGNVLVTNGPFIEVTVNGQEMGTTVVAPDGAIDVHIHVQAAPWVDVSRVTVRRGGKTMGLHPDILEVIPVKPSDQVERLDVVKHYTGISDGSFIVVDAQGDKDMWPVQTPYEQASIEISDAVGVIGAAFGFGNKYGKYKPVKVQQCKPYAFTNPVWVDRTLKQSLKAPKRVLPVSASEPYEPGHLVDLRRLYGAFHSDPE